MIVRADASNSIEDLPGLAADEVHRSRALVLVRSSDGEILEAVLVQIWTDC